ncbi:sensor histidine kinase [Pseudobdellovibrio sp. HCB154]|uniref:sensor histidine kinase n=1 Tax=Pseudobdellovibrio sp. HCB154 TaxID=3386277 RepID=UPI0039173A27
MSNKYYLNTNQNLAEDRLLKSGQYVETQLKNELVKRSRSAAPAFIAISMIFFFAPLGLEGQLGVVARLLLAAAFVVALIRYFYCKKALKLETQAAFDKAYMAIEKVIWVHSLSWALFFGMALINASDINTNFVIAYLSYIGFMTSSIASLSVVPEISKKYQYAMGIAAFVAVGVDAVINRDYGLFSFCVISFVFMVYVLRQSKDYYLQNRSYYQQQWDLLLANDNLIKETTRAEGAARMAAVGRLAAGVAHELNSPLMAASVSLQQTQRLVENELAKNAMQERVAENLSLALRSTEKMSKIINAMRSLEPAGKTDRHIREFTVGELIQNFKDLTAERIKKESIDLQFFSDNEDLKFSSDATIVNQVLLNLFTNAVEAFKRNPEQKTRQVRIVIKQKDNVLIISMANNGPLIETDLRGKIFIPFFTTKELSQGVGLGLNVSQSLLESVGGQLWLDKDTDMTQFSISIPMQKR